MTLLHVPVPGVVELDFRVGAGGALEVLAGKRPFGC
jgi:hypothetical protein